MTLIQRNSPVSFHARPAKTEDRTGWKVVLEYEEEGKGPWLVDLSHCQKWDYQNPDMTGAQVFSIPVPDAPGKSILKDGFLLNRMNMTQVSIWRLQGDPLENPVDSGYTETTEGQVLLALSGKGVFGITEKLTSLNLAEKGRTTPFLIQGPFSHVPCQIVILERNGQDGQVLVSCSRGYAHDMVHAIMDAGNEFGLRPAGEKAFVKAPRPASKKAKAKGAR